MKTAVQPFMLALLVAGIACFAQPAEAWSNRPAVLRAAEILQDEVERLDTALHEIHAPAFLIDKMHHFERTVTEFVDETRRGWTYQEAYSEMHHIRQDVGFIRDEFDRNPSLLNYPKVYLEWRHVRTAYRNLDHEMFVHVIGRFSPQAVAKLKAEVKEMQAYHANGK